MKIQIDIKGQLEVDDDDLERFQKKAPAELLGALILNNAQITTRVSEVYEKQGKKE